MDQVTKYIVNYKSTKRSIKMTTYDKDSEEYKSAKVRVEEIRGFWSHLAVFIIVNIGIFIINMLTSPHQLWFYWPLIGWGDRLVRSRLPCIRCARYIWQGLGGEADQKIYGKT